MENETSFDDEIIKKRFPKLYNALFGPQDSLQDQLILASLFVMSFECLKDYVEESFQTFFTNGFRRKEDGKVEWLFSKDFIEQKTKYQSLYKGLAKNLLNKDVKGVNLFQTGIAWFYDHKAISDDDFLLINSTNTIRNDLAHELYKWLLDDEAPSISRNFVYAPLNLYFKISNWWVNYFEAEIDPEGYQHFSEEDMKSASAFNVQMLLQILHRFFPDEAKPS